MRVRVVVERSILWLFVWASRCCMRAESDFGCRKSELVRKGSSGCCSTVCVYMVIEVNVFGLDVA